MIFMQLFYAFFRIGLFAVGGGQTTIPFLYELCDTFKWYTPMQLADMIAISESTPGPIGINMATYAGFSAAGIAGGFMATFALVLPSVVIIILISKALNKWKENAFVEHTFAVLRPCVVGLIASAGMTVFSISVLDIAAFNESNAIMDLFLWKQVILFVGLFLVSWKYKKHPIFYLSIAMVMGIILQM